MRPVAPTAARLAASALAVLAACRGPDACPANYSCAPPPAGLLYSAEIIPGPLSSSPRQEVLGVTFVESTWVTTVPIQPARPTQHVTQTIPEIIPGSDPHLRQVAATFSIVASRPSLIDGLPPVTKATQTADGTVKLNLLEGLYTLRVLPEAAAQLNYVPLTATIHVPPAPEDPPTLTLPATDAIHLDVTDAAGNGLDDVTLLAVDPSSGAVLSTQAAPASDTNYNYVFNAVRTTPLRLVAQSPSSPVNFHLDPAIGTVQPVIMRLPCAHVCPQPQPGYKLQILGPTGEAVVGARVDASVDLSDPGSPTRATFAATALSDAMGDASFALIPGGAARYVVAVSPADESAYARKTVGITVGPPGTLGLGAPLGLRQFVQGVLVGTDGAPISGALVSTRTTTPPDDGGLGVPLPQTTTDDDGHFSLPLSPGTYDLEVVPQYTALLARWTFPAAALVSDGRPTSSVTLVLPRTAAATLVLLATDGSKEIGAQVLLYDASGPACAPGASCPAPALRGIGTSGADGVVRMLLAVPP